MDHLHTNWKDKVANMGEAPEVPIGDMLAFRTLQAGMSTHYTAQRNPAWTQAFAAMQAARQAAGLAPYADDAYLRQRNAEIPPYAPFDLPTLTDAIELPATVTRESIDTFLGRSWASRVRRRQRWAGTFVVAKQLRKQGVGLLVARLLLLGRP